MGVPQQGTAGKGGQGHGIWEAPGFGSVGNCFGGSEPERDLMPLEEQCPQGSTGRL